MSSRPAADVVRLALRAIALAVVSTTLLSAQQRSAAELLQSGVIQETVKGDLSRAIELYRQAAETAGADRATAAKAQLRLGAAYQKQGDRKARALFESLARDYADRSEAVEARARLGALSAFGGVPIGLPGIIEAENFDKGGEGVAYHDTDAENLGTGVRTTEAVDVDGDCGGTTCLGYVRAGEWLHYTVNVTAAGPYVLTARVAAIGYGGTFHVEFNGANVTGPMTVPRTGSWTSFVDISQPVTLTAGTQVMRVVIDTNGETGVMGNIDRFTLSRSRP